MVYSLHIDKIEPSSLNGKFGMSQTFWNTILSFVSILGLLCTKV